MIGETFGKLVVAVLVLNMIFPLPVVAGKTSEFKSVDFSSRKASVVEGWVKSECPDSKTGLKTCSTQIVQVLYGAEDSLSSVIESAAQEFNRNGIGSGAIYIRARDIDGNRQTASVATYVGGMLAHVTNISTKLGLLDEFFAEGQELRSNSIYNMNKAYQQYLAVKKEKNED